LIAQVSVHELAERLKASDANRQPVVLDVREPWEVAHGVIPGSVLIPMGELMSRVQELDPDREIVCVCHHGMRSMQVGLFLSRNGFDRVNNLTGGIDAWAQQIDPAMPQY
jgi:rhodanese-related sulfurtransferase